MKENTLLNYNLEQMAGLNSSSYSSINNVAIAMLDVFTDIERLGGEPSSVMMDLFSESKPELFIIPLLFEDFCREYKVKMKNCLSSLNFGRNVIYMLNVMTHILCINYRFFTVKCTPVNMFVNHLADIDIQYLNKNEMLDDFREYISYIYLMEPFMKMVNKGLVYKALESYLNVIEDLSVSDFLDLNKKLEEIHPELAPIILHTIITYVQLNDEIRQIQIHKNHNNLIVRYIYKYRILEMMKNV